MFYSHTGGSDINLTTAGALWEDQLPLRFRKAGKVWSGGAWETHWATCQMEWLLAKPRSFSNLPAFLDLNGSFNLPYFDSFLKFWPRVTLRKLDKNFFETLSDNNAEITYRNQIGKILMNLKIYQFMMSSANRLWFFLGFSKIQLLCRLIGHQKRSFSRIKINVPIKQNLVGLY